MTLKCNEIEDRGSGGPPRNQGVRGIQTRCETENCKPPPLRPDPGQENRSVCLGSSESGEPWYKPGQALEGSRPYGEQNIELVLS